VTQVKIESSKVAAPDLSAHARSRAASLLGTDDFASMIDAPHNDAPTTPTHTETRPAKDSRPSERSSSHRTDSTVPSDRPPSRRSDRPEATPRVETTAGRVLQTVQRMRRTPATPLLRTRAPTTATTAISAQAKRTGTATP